MVLMLVMFSLGGALQMRGVLQGMASVTRSNNPEPTRRTRCTMPPTNWLTVSIQLRRGACASLTTERRGLNLGAGKKWFLMML